MKVVLIGPYPPPHGGVQTHLVALQRYLQSEGLDVSVISVARHTGRDPVPGVAFPSTSIGVLWRILRSRADVLHCHVGGTLPIRVLGLLLLTTLMPGTRSVLTFHSGGFPSSPAGRRTGPRGLTARILRRMDTLIAVNGEIADWFRKLGVRPTRIRVISPFSGLPLVPAQTPVPAWLESFVRAHDPVITSVGLLEPEYELGLQMEALGELRRHLPDAGLLIVGSGSLAGALHEKRRKLAYADHVLLAGDLRHETTLRAVAQSDVLIRTTRYDGDALSVREALALGVPVVATDTGMRPDGVILTPPGDRRALIKTVLATLRQPRVPTDPTLDWDAGGSLAAVLGAYRDEGPHRASTADNGLAGKARRSA